MLEREGRKRGRARVRRDDCRVFLGCFRGVFGVRGLDIASAVFVDMIPSIFFCEIAR
jgi:hypothetical protein